MSDIDSDNPTFRIGTTFPSTQKEAAFIRFLIASRQLFAFMKTMQSLTPAATPGQQEQQFCVLFATTASAKEAADAFRDADSNGCFDWIPRTAFGPSLEAARSATDPQNSASIYKRRLTPIRDKASYHWNRNLVAEALQRFALDSYAMYEGDSETRDSSVPLARDIAVEIAGIGRLTAADITLELNEIIVFQGHLLKLAHAVYVVLVRASR